MKNNYLKSKIVLHGETMEDLAKILGITIQTLSRKIAGQADFTQTEMNVIRDHYNLSDSEYVEIFKKDVSLNESKRSS